VSDLPPDSENDPGRGDGLDDDDLDTADELDDEDDEDDEDDLGGDDEAHGSDETGADREDGGGPEASRTLGEGGLKGVLEYIARSLVDDPDAVRVVEVEGGDTLILKLTVGPDDVGKIIGRRGRMARAIRDVVRAAGTKSGVTATVEIVG
jgi:predicted RNA-binding protein YlqC (UPF0109 family)